MTSTGDTGPSLATRNHEFDSLLFFTLNANVNTEKNTDDGTTKTFFSFEVLGWNLGPCPC
jgi:hypothetical protein